MTTLGCVNFVMYYFLQLVFEVEFGGMLQQKVVMKIIQKCNWRVIPVILELKIWLSLCKWKWVGNFTMGSNFFSPTLFMWHPDWSCQLLIWNDWEIYDSVRSQKIRQFKRKLCSGLCLRLIQVRKSRLICHLYLVWLMSWFLGAWYRLEMICVIFKPE